MRSQTSAISAKTMSRAAAALILAAGVAVSAFAQKQSEMEKHAVGTWYGEFAPTSTQPIQKFVTTRSPDGTFTVQARVYEGGKMVSDLQNRGLWGISNGLYVTITTEVNGRKTDLRQHEMTNAYLVQRMSASEFEYVHITSGRTFLVKTVEPGTRLPD